MVNCVQDIRIQKSDRSMKEEIIPYGVRMVGADLEWKETMGAGIKVGIIDTGIDARHVDLKDRIASYQDFTKEDLYDYNGHGTHVAGTIAASLNNVGVVGVAPEAELYIAKAFSKAGTAGEDSILHSLEWLLNQQVDVVNMSFTAPAFTKEYETLIKECNKSGICLIAAAGNESTKGVGYPAQYKETVCVAAVDMSKNHPVFSSVGKRVDVVAAGVDIYSTYPNNEYAVLSGTSMATPIISGAVAILQAKAKIRFGKKLSPQEIKLLLQMYSDDLGTFGKDDHYGFGLFSFGRLDGPDTIRR